MLARASISSAELRRLLPLTGCAWLWGAAACAEAPPDDADRLSSLSTGQLRALCAEIEPGWADRGELVGCDNGWTLYLDSEGVAACGTQRTACSASVGQWRACMRALFADSCQVPEQEPAECVLLRSAEGCSGLDWPLESVCTPPTEQQAAAFAGLYEVTSRTSNTAGCGAEGARALPPEGHLAVLALRSPGVPGSPLQDGPALGLQSCGSIEHCQQQVAELLSQSQPYLWLYSGASNADLPNGFVCAPDSAGTLSDFVVVLETSGNGCVRTSLAVSLRLEPDETLQLEVQTFELRLPATGEPCFTTLEPDARGSCISSDVRRARRVAPL